MTYGPFGEAGPQGLEAGLPGRERVLADLQAIRKWGGNAVRVYVPPPPWFLDACLARGLTIFTGLAWPAHVDFLASRRSRQAALASARQAALLYAEHTAVGAIVVGNEIDAPLVRWMGARRVQSFLEDMIDVARQAAPETLICYANYPTTEYLEPGNADFIACNVYLEDRGAFDGYVKRLQNIAGDKPLVMTEFGVDGASRGETSQAETLAWQRQVVRENGVAGNFIFAWTDEWFRGGREVETWKFGLTARDRSPRAAHARLMGPVPPERALLLAPPPMVSVIVCTRNGERTLAECLVSLVALDYSSYEVIVVDDGSTQDIRSIVESQPAVRYVRQEAAGLSVARNTGAAAASGSILAYTDDDCVADEAWLIYIVKAFEDPRVGAAGGPNIPPKPQTLAQACVIAAPGGPAHVLLTDQTAEHVPGCNLAVRHSVFAAVGGFRPKYHAAGDDVDFCWRLLEEGYVIGFAPAAMVWHYRRFTVRAFMKQQMGYGKAEAMLTSRHSARFGQLGGARWRGVVYQPALRRLAHRSSRVYTGVFGTASYQAIYGAPASELGWLITGSPWWLLTLGVAVSAGWMPPLGWLSGGMALATLFYTGRQAWCLPLAPGYDVLRARLCLWWLLIAQPAVRGWARFWWSLRLGARPGGPWMSFDHDGASRRWPFKRVSNFNFWHERGGDRHELLRIMRQALVEATADDGWRDWDLETPAGPWWRARYATVTEYHEDGKTLTKVRMASRLTRAGFCLLAGVALAAGIAAASGLHFIWTCGLFFVFTMGFESWHRRAMQRGAVLVAQAASEAGFLLVPDEGNIKLNSRVSMRE